MIMFKKKIITQIYRTFYLVLSLKIWLLLCNHVFHQPRSIHFLSYHWAPESCMILLHNHRISIPNDVTLRPIVNRLYYNETRKPTIKYQTNLW